MSAPDVLPQPTTFSAISTVGMLMTHSLAAFNKPKEWLRLLMTQPTSGGTNSSIMCHDMVMMFRRSRQRGRDHDDRPGLEQAVDLGERKGFFGHGGPLMNFTCVTQTRKYLILFILDTAPALTSRKNIHHGSFHVVKIRYPLLKKQSIFPQVKPRIRLMKKMDSRSPLPRREFRGNDR